MPEKRCSVLVGSTKLCANKVVANINRRIKTKLNFPISMQKYGLPIYKIR